MAPALVARCKNSRMVPLCPAAGWPPVLGRLAGTAMPPAAAGCLRGPLLFWPKPAGSAVCTAQGASPERDRTGNLQPGPQRAPGTPKVCCKQQRLCEGVAARAKGGDNQLLCTLYLYADGACAPQKPQICNCMHNAYVHNGSVHKVKGWQGAAPSSTPLRRWSRAHGGHIWDRCTAPLCCSCGSLQAAVACSWPA